MGLQINTNVNALNAYRNLTGTQGSMTTSLERLSSGLRINRAADDAAGLAISEKLRSQVNGLNQAQANAQDGVSLIQTAEGALNETHAILQRMRTLAVQSASDTNTVADRAAIQKEITALVTEVNSTTERTQFNGMNLLDGTFTGKSLQIGANQDQTMDVNIQAMNADGLGITGAAKGLAGNGTPGTVGGNVMNGTFTINGADVLNSSGIKVGDWDDTTGVATFDAEQNGTVIDGTVTFGTAATGQTSFSVSSAIDLSTQAGAEAAIGSIDAAIQRVSDQRADLGALQNRLTHTINNLGVSAENLAASESRIRDTDMAKEMTNFSRSQILQQAGISMLAQANQSSQGVLKLLG